MSRHNNVKIYNEFFPKNVISHLPSFQSAYVDVIKSYIARSETIMNYAKKNRRFYYDAQYRHSKQEKVTNKIMQGSYREITIVSTAEAHSEFNQNQIYNNIASVSDTETT